MKDAYTHSKLIDGSSIFLNYWITAVPFASYSDIHYDMSTLPGSKDYLSGASISGFNIGINRRLKYPTKNDRDNISYKKKLEAAIKVVEFISSKNVQKNFFMKGYSVPAMPSLFYDDEVCEIKNCQMFKSMQPVIFSIDKMFNGTFSKFEYDDIYRKYATKFLYEKDVDLKETLQKIEDITKIYYVSYDRTESYIGYISVIVISVISILMLLSLIFPFFENFQPFFKFLPLDSWILLVIGSVLTLCSSLTNIGPVTSTKCHLRLILFGIGLTLYLVNIFYELIVNFPEEIKLCRWIRRHKYLFILFFLSIDALLNELSSIYPYEIKNRMIEDGQNFQICKMYNKFGKSMIILMAVNKIVLLLAILFLIFLEWNLRNIFYEVRFIVWAIYSNLLLIFTSFIVDVSHINNYIVQFIIQGAIIFLVSITSYIFLYGYKLFLAFSRKQNLKSIYISSINKYFIDEMSQNMEENEYSIINSNNTIDDYSCINDESNTNSNTSDYEKRKGDKNKKLYLKILDFHYSTETSYNSKEKNCSFISPNFKLTKMEEQK